MLMCFGNYAFCLMFYIKMCQKGQAFDQVGGAVAEWVRAFARAGDRTVPGRVRTPGFEPHFGKTFRFETLAIPFTPLCQCLSEETVKAVGPFYLVSMLGAICGSAQSMDLPAQSMDP